MRAQITEKKLEPFREAALELADLADNICISNGFKFTLLDCSLWGAVEYKGFLPWTGEMCIAMFYEDFKRFIDICKNKLRETEYYIVDSDNCEQFEEVFVRLAKKSRVTLPEHRKKDEIQYDYFIDILHIFYDGDT